MSLLFTYEAQGRRVTLRVDDPALRDDEADVRQAASDALLDIAERARKSAK